jgi:hypothetical protein
MKMSVSWVFAPCSLVEVYRLIALMMEATSTTETSVNFYQITRRDNPEDSYLKRQVKFSFVYFILLPFYLGYWMIGRFCFVEVCFV